MSKLGTHTGMQPTGLGEFLSGTFNANSPVPMLFALDNNIAPAIAANSPTTKLIFRTQQFGPDNGNMYVGDPIAAGRARFDQCWPVLQQNPADYYALDNEPGRADVEGLTWLCNYYLGEMQRADEVGVKLCVGEWSTGMPPISAAESAKIVELIDSFGFNVTAEEGSNLAKVYKVREQHQTVIDESFATDGAFAIDTPQDYISIYIPMLRYAMAHGHILGSHEYSLYGPMIGSPLCLRYRTLYNALPADARPLFAITEAGPGAGYGTAYSGAAYVNVVADYDAQVMLDRYVLGVALFKLGKGESNMVEVMPTLTQYVIDHPTPDEPPPADEWEFDYWDLDGARVDGNPIHIIMDEAHTLTPHAKKNTLPPPVRFPLTLNPCPEWSGLVVNVNPAGMLYDVGTDVTCEAMV